MRLIMIWVTGCRFDSWCVLRVAPPSIYDNRPCTMDMGWLDRRFGVKLGEFGGRNPDTGQKWGFIWGCMGFLTRGSRNLAMDVVCSPWYVVCCRFDRWRAPYKPVIVKTLVKVLGATLKGH